MSTSSTDHPTLGTTCTGTKSSIDAQIDRLVELGIHAAIGLSPETFRQTLRQLEVHLPGDAAEPDIEAGTADAVLVVNTPRLPIRDLWANVNRAGKPAMERLFPRKPGDFKPTEGLGLPVGDAYLLFGLDRGNATRNVVPIDAAKSLADQERSPLTVEEGTFVLLQWPQFLKPNHCFMMLGSRCGDRRVPAWWLSDRAPRLGWCWEGNPHTWLGFASCLRRSPAVNFGVSQLDAVMVCPGVSAARQSDASGRRKTGR